MGGLSCRNCVGEITMEAGPTRGLRAMSAGVHPLTWGIRVALYGTGWHGFPIP